MSDLPQAKVAASLLAQCKVQASAKDPRLKIEAATWQLFFELPLWKLLKLRDDAIALPANAVEHDEEELPIAASFSHQTKEGK